MSSHFQAQFQDTADVLRGNEYDLDTRKRAIRVGNEQIKVNNEVRQPGNQYSCRPWCKNLRQGLKGKDNNGGIERHKT